MNFNETSKIRGIFDLKVFDANGKETEHYRDENLVVTAGKESLAKLLGSYTADKNVDRIAFGSNGADPILADSAITDQYAKAVTSITFPTANSVAFAFTLELAENNGVTIREYGLLSADDTLFARKSRTAINKTSDVRLEGIWTIIF